MTPDFFAPTSFLRPYPPAAEVFANPVDKHAQHLCPLLSIELSAVNAGWRGWVHLVAPFEPYEGFIGTRTRAHHTYYLRENWLGFRCIDSRYSLLGDFRFFELENPDGPYSRQRSDLKAHCARQRSSFDARRARFRRLGALYHRDVGSGPRGAYAARDRRRLLSELGGRAPAGNWVATDFSVVSRDSPDPRPLTEDGRKFHFIARASAWNYLGVGDHDVLLFYDPPSQVALVTFDYS